MCYNTTEERGITMNENICAISTALGVGAISIIRASGPEVIEITNKIFKGKDLTKVDSHTITYGHIVDHDEVIDEVLDLFIELGADEDQLDFPVVYASALNGTSSLEQDLSTQKGKPKYKEVIYKCDMGLSSDWVNISQVE